MWKNRVQLVVVLVIGSLVVMRFSWHPTPAQINSRVISLFETTVARQPSDPVVKLVTDYLVAYQTVHENTPASSAEIADRQFTDSMRGIVEKLRLHNIDIAPKEVGESVHLGPLKDYLLKQGFYLALPEAEEENGNYFVSMWLTEIMQARRAEAISTGGYPFSFRCYLAGRQVGGLYSKKISMEGITIAKQRDLLVFSRAEEREASSILSTLNKTTGSSTSLTEKDLFLRQWPISVSRPSQHELVEKLLLTTFEHEVQHMLDQELASVQWSNGLFLAYQEGRAQLRAIAYGPLPFFSASTLLVNWRDRRLSESYRLASQLSGELVSRYELTTITEQELRNRALRRLNELNTIYNEVAANSSDDSLIERFLK